MRYVVMYRDGTRLVQKEFADAQTAAAAYGKIGKANSLLPRRIEAVADNGASVVYAQSCWSQKRQHEADALAWEREAKAALKEAGVNAPRAAAICSLSQKVLKRAVRANKLSALTALPGIGAATARKAVAALWPLCRGFNAAMKGSCEFKRVTLHMPDDKGVCFTVDTIHKTVSPAEQKAFEIGGPNAVIHVSSILPNARNKEEKQEQKIALEAWKDACEHGLALGKNTYVFFGHGTNAAKMCKSVWVEKSIYPAMREFMLAGTNPEWRTTTAKKIAYLTGLQLVSTDICGIPFEPEDFCVMPSVYTEAKGRFKKSHSDGSAEWLPADHKERIIRSDGYMCIDIPDEMVPTFVERLVKRGVPKELAEERVAAFRDDIATATYRCKKAGLKSCGSKRFSAHKFLESQGKTKTPNGRDISRVSVFMDETVLKTKLGEHGAYADFDEWADKVRQGLKLGVCVSSHELTPKAIPYQVIQCLTEATEEQIAGMARPTIDLIKEAGDANAAYKLLGGELAHIASIMPGITKTLNVGRQVEQKLKKLIDTALSGKLLAGSHYAFMLPDEVLVFQGWFGLEMTGCLEEGECWMPAVSTGIKAFWRNPIMHPTSLCLLNNVNIKDEFRQFFKGETSDIMLNSKDTTTVKTAGDFDGDHMSESNLNELIDALEATLKVWNYTQIWDAPESKKQVVTREDEIEYIKALTKGNDLGLTVYKLNALLNQVLEDKNGNRSHHPIEPLGVDFGNYAGNVLVDAAKHGSCEVKPPKEFTIASRMVQPLAVQYRKTLANDKLSEQEKAERCMALIEEGRSVVHPAGALDKLFAVFARELDVSCVLHGEVPDFDFHQLMFNPEENMRGLSGLFREGKEEFMTIDGESVRADQGCFNAIANRLAAERKKLMTLEIRDRERLDFNADFRVSALAELEQYAAAYGRTLQDVYDVVTFRMFKLKEQNEGKHAFLTDRLWKAYWTVFGGMAEQAAMRWETGEYTESVFEDVDDIGDVEGDEYGIDSYED